MVVSPLPPLVNVSPVVLVTVLLRRAWSWGAEEAAPVVDAGRLRLELRACLPELTQTHAE